jgi:hypothetical protein
MQMVRNTSPFHSQPCLPAHLATVCELLQPLDKRISLLLQLLPVGRALGGLDLLVNRHQLVKTLEQGRRQLNLAALQCRQAHRQQGM